MDKEKIEQAVRLFLEGIGEDPNREGLLGTLLFQNFFNFSLIKRNRSFIPPTFNPVNTDSFL